MPSQKLLIADSNKELCHTLAGLLSERYQISICHSGDQALELIKNISPDLIYIDLMLPQMDGLAVLQAARQQGIHASVLVSVGLQSPYIERALSRLQADYVLKKPCSVKVIAGHIDELADAVHDKPVKASDLQTQIAEILVQMGFKNNFSGFRYVVSGLPMFAENPQQTVTKELYPAIGKLHGKTGEQVERAIRNAIELAWQRRDERIWRMYFAPAPDGSIPRPTNGQLLHTLMRQICGLQKDEKVG